MAISPAFSVGPVYSLYSVVKWRPHAVAFAFLPRRDSVSEITAAQERHESGHRWLAAWCQYPDVRQR